ncbi:hypothetical protein [Streptomyces sp. NPDC045251]|uniref:hypothetical protein n=1 Tax=unclassified Streptomyces TaxID=2593676 RepID=UPI0033EFF5BD
MALARMMPVLEIAGAPFLDEVERIVSACGTVDEVNLQAEVASLSAWRQKIGPLEDSSDATYFQSTAAGVAVLVADVRVLATDRDWRIVANVSNFWASCDDILHRGDGFSRGEFRGVKTTLEGVENLWKERDEALLSGHPEASLSIFLRRLSEIRSHYPKRRQVARIIGECAGW